MVYFIFFTGFSISYLLGYLNKLKSISCVFYLMVLKQRTKYFTELKRVFKPFLIVEPYVPVRQGVGLIRRFLNFEGIANLDRQHLTQTFKLKHYLNLGSKPPPWNNPNVRLSFIKCMPPSIAGRWTRSLSFCIPGSIGPMAGKAVM
jgi:hypothetical protein